MVLITIHNPSVFAFGILGNIISVFVYLAPLPTFYRIYKKKSTEGFRCLPYLVALFSSMLWLYYAYLKKDAILLVTINSFGCVVESIYIIMYFFYAPREAKKSTLMIFTAMNLGLLSLLILVTQFLANGDQRATVFGWICVAISVSVFAAPLSIVAQVIRTKSVEYMPFYLSFFLTLSAIMWFGYGLLQKDLCIALPNVLGFLLGVSQMLLYGIYKRIGNKMIIMDTKLPKDSMLRPLGTNRVHEVVLDVKVDGDAMRDEQPQEAENEGNKNGKEDNNKTDDTGDNDLPKNECGV